MKVAIIGCGTIANNAHIPSYMNCPDAEIKYFCDIIPERAEAAVEKYGCGIAVTDYHDILNDPEIEAVSVCTPNKVHSTITIDFLNAGKNVLCEKPAAINLEEALKMQEAGASIDEIVAWIEENKLNFCQQFTVDDLHHLHRGGRVSKTTAIVGTLINVKPVLHVTDEGKLHSLSNVRGRKKALNTLVDNMIKNMDGYDGDTSDVFISHGDCLEDAEYVAELIRTRLGIQNITISYISATIGAHAGPNTVALFYMGNKR